jgi:CRP-like cAMP-binding protein
MVKGSYFGEIDVIEKARRQYSVIAGEPCDTLTLTKQIYENVIVKEYPEVDSEIRYTAMLRVGKLQEADGRLRDKLWLSKKRASGSYIINI